MKRNETALKLGKSVLDWLSWVRPLRWFFHRRRWFTVSIESPSRLTGFPHRVKAYDEEGAMRKTTYYWFQNCWGDEPWYRWHFKVIA